MLKIQKKYKMYLKIHFIPPTKMCMTNDYKSKIWWSNFLVLEDLISVWENIQRKTNDLCTNNGDFSVKYKKCVNVWLIEINYLIANNFTIVMIVLIIYTFLHRKKMNDWKIWCDDYLITKLCFYLNNSGDTFKIFLSCHINLFL